MRVCLWNLWKVPADRKKFYLVHLLDFTFLFIWHWITTDRGGSQSLISEVRVVKTEWSHHNHGVLSGMHYINSSFENKNEATPDQHWTSYHLCDCGLMELWSPGRGSPYFYQFLLSAFSFPFLQTFERIEVCPEAVGILSSLIVLLLLALSTNTIQSTKPDKYYAVLRVSLMLCSSAICNYNILQGISK